MNYISVSQLRTKSTELVEALLVGKSVDLLYRSTVVGRISPIVDKEEDDKAGKFYAFLKSLPRRKGLTHEKGMKIYHKRLMNKYDKGLS